MFFSIFIGNLTTKYGETYKYDSIKLKNYAVTRDNYEEYTMRFNEFENYSFTLSQNKHHNLVLTNNNTEYAIEIECEDLRDYLIIEQKDYFILSYIDYTDSRNYFLKYIYLPKKELSNEDSYLNNIKNNLKKYLIPTSGELLVLSDYDNNISYVSSYDVDSGYYVLVSEDNVSILNRD